MGRRGPPKMPTVLRIATGNKSKTPIDPNEPKADPRRPDKPEYLDEAASAEWDRITPIIAEMGTLSRDSGPSLSVYCEAYSDWLKAKETYRKQGIVLVCSHGEKLHPAFTAAKQCAELMLKCLREFGLTPASRAGISLDKAVDSEEDLDAFVSKKKGTG